MLNDTRTERNLSFDHFIACDCLPSCENTSRTQGNVFACTFYQNNQLQKQIRLESPNDKLNTFHQCIADSQESLIFLYHSERLDPNDFYDRELLDQNQCIGLDIQLLSKILIPLLNSHTLSSLIHYFEITHISDSKDFISSEHIADIFSCLKELTVKLDNKPLQAIIQLLKQSKNSLAFFFEFIYNQPKCRKPDTLNVINYPVNVLGNIQNTERKKANIIDLEEKVHHFFAPGGLLASQFDQYEPRKSQQKMAAAIFKNFIHDEILIAEAGTGIGKSLAYLVPTVYFILNHLGAKAVISTHTKTLQEQLFYKDIPLMQQLIADNFLVVLLKGRGNYICLKRFFELLEHADHFLTDDQKIQLLTLIPWLNSTRTGDIEENNGFSSLQSKSVWHLVNAAENNCARGQCDYEANCFLQKVRKSAKSANILIVNHSLLFSNLAQQNSTLGDIKTLIVDEAHHIEKSASQYLGDSISKIQLLDIAHWLYQVHPFEKGVVLALQIGLNKSVISEEQTLEIDDLIKDLKQLSFELKNHSNKYFKSLGQSVKAHFKSKEGQFKLRLTPSNTPFAQNMEVFFQLKSSFLSITKIVDKLQFIYQTDVSKFTTQFEFALNDLIVLSDRLNMWQLTLESFFDMDPDKVYWCQQVFVQKKIEYSFHSVPIDMASILSDRLFANLERAVLTSATLAVNDSFDYVKYRWGLHFLDNDIVKTHNFHSPFLYPEQMQFLVANYLAHPKTAEYTADVAQFINSTMTEIKRNTLVLFTSYQMLRAVYNAIKQELKNQGVLLLAQGIHGSRSSILKKFKASNATVLLGTSSFWEGVDIPGDALQCVIITRLPFDVPTDPVIQARVQRIEENKGNAFFQYTIPEALVKFRQGIGRLIRSGQDIGSMIVLDNRIVSTQYGRLFLNASPVNPVICNSDEETINQLIHWF